MQRMDDAVRLYKDTFVQIPLYSIFHVLITKYLCYYIVYKTKIRDGDTAYSPSRIIHPFLFNFWDLDIINSISIFERLIRSAWFYCTVHSRCCWRIIVASPNIQRLLLLIISIDLFRNWNELMIPISKRF